MDLGRYAPDLRDSGLLIVVVSYTILIIFNAATLPFGPLKVLEELNSSPLAPALSIVVYDTPWSLTGIAGLVLLFGAVLFGEPVARRLRLSIFFAVFSIVAGIAAGILWDTYYDTTGLVGAGVSAIAIAGQGIVFTLAIFGVLRLLRQDTRSLGRMSSYWWNSFMMIYLTLIATTLLFVVVLQSIFVPTELYNWRVHEFAFFISIGGTVVYETAFWRKEGLDGNIVIDETLANFHFDDLNGRFERPLPKLKVSFRELPAGVPGDFDPDASEVLVPMTFRGKPYKTFGSQFDGSLLHGMAHAELFYERKPWRHGDAATKDEFNELAGKVGALPES